MGTTSKQVAAQARAAGYEVIEMEQMRPNRWLMMLREPGGETSITLVQQRSLVGATDVQDLADLLRLRQAKHGILLALDGRFSAIAHHTVRELRDIDILLCTTFPLVHLPQNPAPVLGSV